MTELDEAGSLPELTETFAIPYEHGSTVRAYSTYLGVPYKLEIVPQDAPTREDDPHGDYRADFQSHLKPEDEWVRVQQHNYVPSDTGAECVTFALVSLLRDRSIPRDYAEYVTLSNGDDGVSLQNLWENEIQPRVNNPDESDRFESRFTTTALGAEMEIVFGAVPLEWSTALGISATMPESSVPTSGSAGTFTPASLNSSEEFSKWMVMEMRYLLRESCANRGDVDDWSFTHFDPVERA